MLFEVVRTVFTHSGVGGVVSVHDIQGVWKEQTHSSTDY